MEWTKAFPARALRVKSSESVAAWIKSRGIMWFMYSVWIGTVLSTAFGAVYLAVSAGFMLQALVSGEDPLRIVWEDSLLLVGLPFTVLYAVSQYYGRLGVWEEFRAFFMNTVAKYPYFDATGYVMEDCAPHERFQMVPDDKEMMAFHPHGFTSLGWSINGVYNHALLPGKFRWLATSTIFVIPFLRNVMAYIGAEPVSKSNMKKLMSESRNICLIPGGYEEATIYSTARHRVYLKNRAGFIKLALQYGYKVRPVYTFGEEQAFWAFPYLVQWRLLLNRVKLPGCICYGIWWCFYLPFPNIKLVTVFGKPIQLPRIEHPSRDDVAKYHAIYIQALQDLFDRNKHIYTDDPSAVLEIF